MGKARDISKVFSTGTALATDSEISAFNYLTQASASTVYQTKATNAMTLINTTNFTGVASVSLPQDSFTTTYDNYRIIFAFTQSVSGSVDIRMRLAGTDNTANSYQVQRLDLQGTTFANSRSTGTAAGIGQGGTSGPQIISFDIYGPKLAQNTLFRSVNVPTDAADTMMRDVVGRHTVATAFDSMTFISNGTVTGTISVYGYNK
jgi:hypothetical protein